MGHGEIEAKVRGVGQVLEPWYQPRV